MIIASKYEVPDVCPENCPEKNELFYQGNPCSRCPVFNCNHKLGPGGEPFCLLEPEDYREDWAKEWSEWFKNGMKGYPELRLEIDGGK